MPDFSTTVWQRWVEYRRIATILGLAENLHHLGDGYQVESSQFTSLIAMSLGQRQCGCCDVGRVHRRDFTLPPGSTLHRSLPLSTTIQSYWSQKNLEEAGDWIERAKDPSQKGWVMDY
jgi:hypothetical protein